jgi:polysaccharide pyruvyl transferase WcaK-like protein
MKIGVLTFHSVTNFGAALQCLGLTEACKLLRPEAEVEVINYKPRQATAFYLRTYMWRRRDFSYLIKMLKFSSFRRKFLKMSGPAIRDRKGLRSLAGVYDIVIVGSDEVWKTGKIRGWDPSYFLDFVDPNHSRLISYGASSSIATSYDGIEDEIRHYLSRFSHISVRDEHTLQAISRLTDKYVTDVVDPTLLVDFTTVLPRMKTRLVQRKYVLVYAKLAEREKSVLTSWARAHDLLVVSIGRKNRHYDRAFTNVGPVEWLELFRGADVIITNYYHGMLFSIKLGKPFIPLHAKGKMAKVSDIARKLGFEGRIARDMSCLEARSPSHFVVDQRVQVKLRPLIDHSISYLRGALK